MNRGMVEEENLAFALLDRLESIIDIAKEHERLGAITLAACELVLPALEERQVMGALETSRRYWKRKASETELGTARAMVWSKIQPGALDSSDSSVCAVRLLMCALYGRCEDLTLDQDGRLYTILSFAVGAGVCETRLAQLVGEHFGLELGLNDN